MVAENSKPKPKKVHLARKAGEGFRIGDSVEVWIPKNRDGRIDVVVVVPDGVEVRRVDVPGEPGEVVEVVNG